MGRENAEKKEGRVTGVVRRSSVSEAFWRIGKDMSHMTLHRSIEMG